MVYLQERDKFLLKMMGAYGILNNKTITGIYDNRFVYPKHRKKALADAKYIIKNNKYAYLGIKGKRYLESIGIKNIKQISGDKYARERLCKISEILVPLNNIYECYPSWKIKNVTRLADRKLQFYGKIRNKLNGNEYYIYNIGNLKMGKDVDKLIGIKRSYIKHIKEEIVQNALIKETADRKIERVIILAGDSLTMQLYKNELESLGVKEQLIIPFRNVGIELLKEFGKRNIKEESIKYLYGNGYGKPDWKYADYTIANNKQAMVLINNDGEKIVKIKQDRQLNQYNFSRKSSIVIICLESQKTTFKKEFPEIEIVTIPDEFI